MREKNHDSTKKTKPRAGGGTGDGAPGGNRRGMAGAKPQQQATALGTLKSAQPRADSHDCRGAGAAANARATAGTAAGAAQCPHRRKRTAGGTNAGARGGGSTAGTTP